MAASEITGLTELTAAPADDDELVIVDVSDTTQSANGSTKRLAASRVARAGAENTFTAPQTINLSNATDIGLSIDTSASPTADAMLLSKNSTAMIRFDLDSAPRIQVQPYDNGSGIGSNIAIYNNNNASTPAAGNLQLHEQDGTRQYVWVDASGNLRIGTTGPSNANDTSGAVVGTQTSWHALKENIAEWDGAEALDAIRALTLYSYQMVADGHKTPSGEKPVYKGLVITDEDRGSDAWFGLGYADNQTPVLNTRNLYGYMLAAIRHGGDIIEELQTKVATLEARIAALESA